MKVVLELKKGAKLRMRMHKANMKMININMKKDLEKMSFLKVLDLPVILITALLHLMLVELLMMAMVLLVSMRGARVVFHLLLWKEDKDQKLQQLLMEMMVAKTPRCVLEGPWISVCPCARVSLPGCTGPVCRSVRTGAWS